mmetsp:Transcript_48748/g.123651  ORF Transcript_48748/g.123651 Transcript_48748/m.123651 type:complete len:104 (-) Transcript_48748:133-444(-)
MMRQHISIGTPLLLFNFRSKRVLGMFVAATLPQISIEHNACGGLYPAQVRVTRLEVMETEVWSLHSGPSWDCEFRRLCSLLRDRGSQTDKRRGKDKQKVGRSA